MQKVATSSADYQFLEKLKAFPFVDLLYLFGSRARGNNAARSDIDLVIACPRAFDAECNKILAVIDEADTLLKIDCLRLDTV